MLTANAVPLVPALVGIGGLAALAILKRFSPRPAAAASPKAKQEPTDLLAEAETAAIAAALAEKAARAGERSSEEPPTEENTEPLAWDECEEVYTPAHVEAGAFLRSLG